MGDITDKVKVKVFKRYPYKFIIQLYNRLMTNGKRFIVYSESDHKVTTVKWEV
jgi:ribosomal protein S7